MKSSISARGSVLGAARKERCLALALLLWALFVFAACADESKSGQKAAGSFAALPALRESSLDFYKIGKSPKDEWKLPNRLNEISGLATTQDRRLFAHNDERGILYEIDTDDGDILKSFHLGKEGIKADFEGITVVEESFFLVTSKGTLYETVEGADDEEVKYVTYDSGVGDVCEVEGLEYEPDDRTLLLACKTTRGSRLKDGIAIFRWSLDKHALLEPNFIWVSEDEIRRHLPQKHFHPSGIARHPTSKTYFVISAREHALIEITPSGTIVDAKDLKEGRHPHAEGIAFSLRKSGALDLMISDEGDDRRARIARYRDRSVKK
ncbi:MAG: SdiA-regulated domain-containing protein [Myxococcota bacterium]